MDSPAAPPFGPSECGPLQLVVMQPTPFCNINCTYCYLAGRRNKARISVETVAATFEKIFASQIPHDDFAVVWHAGEPLVMGTQFYDEVLSLVDSLKPGDVRVEHAIQTNGTLLTDTWCDLIQRHRIKIGVSLDGPAALHDTSRLRHDGRGTHARVVQAVKLLQRHGIPFSVLAVVTDNTLGHVDEFFDFFHELGVRNLGFNIDEIEGVHTDSTLVHDGAEERHRRFLERLYQLSLTCPEMRIREFTYSEALLQGAEPPLSQVVPFRILTVDYAGNFSTFSPELLDVSHPDFGNFLFGNVLSDELQDALTSQKFRRVWQAIATGRGRCESTCAYYEVCGGGTPVNKLFEHGTFASTETMHCRLTQKVLHGVVARGMLAQLSAERTATVES